MINVTVNNVTLTVNNVTLSSAFTQRMISGEGIILKRDLSLDEAQSLINQAEAEGVFTNAINPRHTSTVIMATGLTQAEAVGGFLSMEEGDAVVVFQPSASSRDATEFNITQFEECSFSLCVRLPLSMIGG